MVNGSSEVHFDSHIDCHLDRSEYNFTLIARACITITNTAHVLRKVKSNMTFTPYDKHPTRIAQ